MIAACAAERTNRTNGLIRVRSQAGNLHKAG
jgi:hypothetical protein